MDEDKKKKKNKKKKNKQNKAIENSVEGDGEHISSGQNHIHETGQKSTGQVHEITDAQNYDVAITDQLRHVANGPEASTLAEAEKHHWLAREASLEEKIKQLQEERDVNIQKESALADAEKHHWLAREASLEKKIKQLQEERDVHTEKESNLAEAEKRHWLAREASLEEKIKQLQEERDAHIQKESTLAEAEKHHWLAREASLEEEIKQLQEERDAHIQKEVILEEKIQQLLKEKDASLAKEANLLEEIEQLQSEKASYSLKEASLEHQISQLEKEKDAYAQKEYSLEEEIARLQSELEACMQKEVQLEETISHLENETANLSLEKAILEEKTKQTRREIDSWVQKENSHQEIVAILNVDNSRQHAQVLQLEQSRNNLLEENQHLKETISSLQSQNLNFEGNAALSYSSTEAQMLTIENGDVSSQIEAAHMLLEKLITENAELVEKVNELYIELNRGSLLKEISSDDGTPGTAESAVVADNSLDLLDLKVGAYETRKSSSSADLMHETGAMMSTLDENVQAEIDVNKDERNKEHMGATNTVVSLNSPDTIDSDEIVQIPLDENERLLTELEAGNNAERTEVPITDAPLIGAPFRVISFVARYVSGADLVEKNSTTAGR